MTSKNSINIAQGGTVVVGNNNAVAQATDSAGAVVTATSGTANRVGRQMQRLESLRQRLGETKPEVAALLEKLIQSIKTAPEFNDDSREDSASLVSEVAEQALIDKVERKPPIYLSAINTALLPILGVSADVLGIWQYLALSLNSTFGFSLR